MEKEMRAKFCEYLTEMEKEITADTEAMAHSFSFDFHGDDVGPSAKPIEYAEAEGDCIQYGIEAIKHIDKLKSCLYRMQFTGPATDIDDLPF